ncbi:MAG: hypothetical protein IKO61_06715 [Lachnospiraceae bacterium]|nr:hypothetical protein [Lachnospiraceae bacterium]
MSESNEKQKKQMSELDVHKSLLKGVAGLNIGEAIAYIVGVILVFVSSDPAKYAKGFFSVTEEDLTEGISLETMCAVTGIFMAIIAIVMAVLIFKGLKPGSKAIVAVEIIAWVSLIGSIIYIIVGETSLSMTASIAIDSMTCTAADFVRKSYKQQ